MSPVSHQQIGTVRERLWLLAHDERRGLEPRLDSGALEIGLLAASVVDLLLAERIVVAGGHVLAVADPLGRRKPVVLDPITAGVLQAVTEENPRLAGLLRCANADLPAGEHHAYVRLYQRTQAALIAAGVVVEQRRRIRTTRYQLTAPGGLGWIKTQISERLVHHSRPGRRHTATAAVDGLCALVGALNLHTQLVLPYPPEESGPILHTITQQISERVGPDSPLAVIPHLAYCVRAAVGDLATAIY